MHNFSRFYSKFIAYTILGIVFLLIVVPFLWMIMSSLKTNNEIMANPLSWPEEIKWVNYQKAWIGGNLGAFFINSVIVTFFSMLGVIAFPLMAGYVFARVQFVGKNILFLIWLSGLLIPAEVKMIPLFVVLNSISLSNTHLGLIIIWWGSTSLALFVFRTFFETIPKELEESATIDGCSDFRFFLNIAVPLSKPAIGVVGIFYTVHIWNRFFEPLIILRSQELYTFPLGLMFFKGQYTVDYGLMFAALTISAIIPILIYAVFQKNFVKGLTSGMGKM
jgi:ABC-type glycerol-3-phosphate transport system permease component